LENSLNEKIGCYSDLKVQFAIYDVITGSDTFTNKSDLNPDGSLIRQATIQYKHYPVKTNLVERKQSYRSKFEH
jgi:hypothetical protein